MRTSTRWELALSLPLLIALQITCAAGALSLWKNVGADHVPYTGVLVLPFVLYACVPPFCLSRRRGVKWTRTKTISDRSRDRLLGPLLREFLLALWSCLCGHGWYVVASFLMNASLGLDGRQLDVDVTLSRWIVAGGFAWAIYCRVIAEHPVFGLTFKYRSATGDAEDLR